MSSFYFGVNGFDTVHFRAEITQSQGDWVPHLRRREASNPVLHDMPPSLFLREELSGVGFKGQVQHTFS